MDDLVQWLKAQLDADQQLAEDARAELDGRWAYVESQDGNHKVVDSLGYSITEHYDVDAQPYFCEPHIAAHDPARVLREIEAKRQIIAQYVNWDESTARAGLGADMRDVGVTEGLEIALRLLTSAYSDRPGYKQEWAPAE